MSSTYSRSLLAQRWIKSAEKARATDLRAYHQLHAQGYHVQALRALKTARHWNRIINAYQHGQTDISHL